MSPCGETSKRVRACFAGSEAFGALCAGLGRGEAQAGGLWGSAPAALLAALYERLHRPVLVICASLDETDDLADDLGVFFGDEVARFPAWDSVPREPEAGDDVLSDRQRLVERLARSGEAPPLTVAPVQALMQPVPSRECVARLTRHLAVGGEEAPERLAAWLVEAGFERVPMVELAGQFAVRGGVFDLWPFALREPLRLEFLGDRVDNIRFFNPATQRSTERVDGVDVSSAAVHGALTGAEYVSLPSLLPADTVVAALEPASIQERAASYLARLADPRGTFSFEGLWRACGRFSRLLVTPLPVPERPGAVNFRIGSVERLSAEVATVKRELADLCRRHTVAVFCDNPAEAQRLEELLADTRAVVGGRLLTEVGALAHGFRLEDADLVLLPNRELFHRYADRRVVRLRRRGRPIETFLELAHGDYVVHLTHGIARFLGMEAVEREGRREDSMVLEFADHVRVYVPASRIELVQKYVGGFERYPRLSRLGTATWERSKGAVREAVTDLAAEMLRLQAVRAAQAGIAYPPDTAWQREFEAAFIYAETPDQLEALAAIKEDMQATKPMDRLLCGDVGYGKTELAIRGAFKVVESGRQVAVLVPTTVLAEQHGRTFAERTADYPVIAEVLSRFKTPREQRDILDRLARHQVDILIGTHRLLQDDVQFADLGLVIVDEEQRFGVQHKERLKRFRETVDVLTLTATPIPRTLHMALLGLRDISSLETPPADRLAIHTEVIAFDEERIRQAILRELNRDGQVFFVHNRVQSIEAVAAMLRRIVPEARIIVGHGQMPERELAAAMLDFVERRADVLVATTIIENGLDIPAVNTIFIHDADIYGLADLHQLRGRVGRYKYRAHCYLTLPQDRPVTETAAKRLRAIEEFTELGAGFKIAMRDLEIRGAGNILGTEQSGHIAAVGYDLYCRLLEHAVRDLKGEPPVPEVTCRVDLRLDAVIPSAYVRDDRQKMTIYRRLARARRLSDLETIAQELADIYGPIPDEMQSLIDQAEVRLLAAWRRVTMVTIHGQDLVFRTDDVEGLTRLLRDADPCASAAERASKAEGSDRGLRTRTGRGRRTLGAEPRAVRQVDERTVHLRLWPGAAEDPPRLLHFLRDLLRHGGSAPAKAGG